MIPRANITAWRRTAPWPENAQVEQDLVLSRALVELFSRPAVAEQVSFRGGTALHKLYFDPPGRYSEDIDLVQRDAGPIGPLVSEIRAALDPWLGPPKWKAGQGRFTLFYRFATTFTPVVQMRVKIEINTREHFAVHGFTNRPLVVANPWFSGEASVSTYALSELLGTKLRALYQRKKGRDLFDLMLGLDHPELDPALLVAVLRALHGVRRGPRHSGTVRGEHGGEDGRRHVPRGCADPVADRHGLRAGQGVGARARRGRHAASRGTVEGRWRLKGVRKPRLLVAIWKKWQTKPPRVFAVGDSADLHRLVGACWAAGVPVAAPADVEVGFRTTGRGTRVIGGVRIEDRLLGTRTYCCASDDDDQAAALTTRGDWLVVDERMTRASGALDAVEAWNVLRPWVLSRDAYCLKDEPILQPSWEILLNWGVIHMVPQFAMCRNGSGTKLRALIPQIQASELRLQRLIQIRDRIEQAYFTGKESYHDEIDLMVDSLLVFGTAALDTLACLLFDTAQVSTKPMARSMRTLRPTNQEFQTAIDAIAGQHVDLAATDFDALQLALDFLYRIRNRAGHSEPGESQRYRVTGGMVGMQNKFYDAPDRPLSRRRVQGSLGFGGGRGAGEPLLPIDVVDGITVDHVESWNASTGVVGVYTDRRGGGDVAFVDPLLFAGQVVAFAARWMSDAISGVVRLLEQHGEWPATEPMPLATIETHLDHLDAITWRVAGAFTLEPIAPCSTPFRR